MTNELIGVVSAVLSQTNHATDHAVSMVEPYQAPSAMELMLRGLLSAALYGVLGIGLLLLGFKLFDAITPKIDVQKELADNKNMAVAIVVGAVLIGIAVMLGHVISA
ncbi:MAG: DUF350 domain-containing protein [Phycisphaerales bacterium]